VPSSMPIATAASMGKARPWSAPLISASSFCSHRKNQSAFTCGAALPRNADADADHSEEYNAHMTSSAAPELCKESKLNRKDGVTGLSFRRSRRPGREAENDMSERNDKVLRALPREKGTSSFLLVNNGSQEGCNYRGPQQQGTEQWEKAKKSRIGRKTKHEPIHGTRIYSTSISVIVMHAARPGVDRSSIVSPFRRRGVGVGVAARAGRKAGTREADEQCLHRARSSASKKR